MNQSNLTTNGFYNSMLNDNVTSIRDGIHGLSTQLCNCCSDMAQTVNSGFANAEVAANARQIANMQTAFNGQMATMQGFNDVQEQLAQCCCDNRLATCQTQNIVQNEGNATRFADANNTRDIIDSQTRSTQAILDKLCQLELDGVKAQVEAKNDRIAELQTQLNMANLRESQTAQNAFIANGQCYATYQVTFNGNIAIPTGGAVTPIGVAITVSGEPRLTSRAILTPAAVDDYGNVTSTAIIKVPKGCCFSLSVDYVQATDDPTVTPTPLINVQNANLTVARIA